MTERRHRIQPRPITERRGAPKRPERALPKGTIGCGQGIPSSGRDLLGSLSSPAARLRLSLVACSAAVEKQLNRYLKRRFKTSVVHHDVLAALALGDAGVAMGDLARRVSVTPSRLTFIVRDLERASFVVSAASPTDRRFSIVSLTSAGRRHFEEVTDAHDAYVTQLFGPLTAAKTGSLQTMLVELRGCIGASS